MKYAKPFVVLSFSALLGCASIDPAGPEIVLTPALQRAVAASVANAMKDPASAQFRNWHAFRAGSGVVVCGQVNAKNSYGGYVGFVGFFQRVGVTGAGIEPPVIQPMEYPELWIAGWRKYYPGCF